MMIDFNKRACLAISLSGLAPTKNNKLLDLIEGRQRQFVEGDDKLFKEIEKFLSAEDVQKIKTKIDKVYLDSFLQENIRLGINVITAYCDTYPSVLKEWYDYPLTIFAKGDLTVLQGTCLAIVGSRSISRYGREVTEEFSKALSEAGLVIISGLAKGADTIAHSATIACGGKTVAVVASGLDTVYPPENFGLQEEILKSGGLVISEYPIGTQPMPFRFPERNRLIAGLARGVLVTEAGERSGAMITACHAIDFGLEVFVVPSAITNVRGRGGNNFIKQYADAFTTSPPDILQRFNMHYVTKEAAHSKLEGLAALIVEELLKEELHFEQLLELTQMDVSMLGTLLLQLELDGNIKKLAGNFYGV